MTQVQFQQVFSAQPSAELFAPGRINLIGEHIDYCGGVVMPMAINRGTRGWVKQIQEAEIQIYSSRFDELIKIPLEPGEPRQHWSDFVVGVVSLLLEKRWLEDKDQQQHSLNGLQLYVSDDIDGGGLSSSASFSLLISHALLWAAGKVLDTDSERIALAKLCRQVEHNYIGVNCGIMDQASIALGGIVLLDCDDLEFKRVDGLGHSHRIVVMDTRHPRSLAGSKYNERVREIASIHKELKPVVSISELCELSVSQLPDLTANLSSAVLAKRLRHVVTENDRVQRAQLALADTNIELFGQLLKQSHESLRLDYEVTGQALDSIVSISQAQAGCVGARMTGAGFGGCAIALVEVSHVDTHNAIVERLFEANTGVKPNIFTVEAAPATGLV